MAIKEKDTIKLGVRVVVVLGVIFVIVKVEPVGGVIHTSEGVIWG